MNGLKSSTDAMNYNFPIKDDEAIDLIGTLESIGYNHWSTQNTLGLVLCPETWSKA
jgi:hypothetical protein